MQFNNNIFEWNSLDSNRLILITCVPLILILEVQIQ